MQNFIQINGKRIELTPEQIQEIVNAYNSEPVQKKLADIDIGKTFFIGETQFIVLGQYDEETAVITKNVLKKMAFGESNNFDGSAVDAYCKEFAGALAQQIGERNIVEHTVDLTSDDGLKDYGAVTRKVSLLTAEMYRSCVDVLDQYKTDCWWWLATPFSTLRHENADWAKCVSPAGVIGRDSFSRGYRGVRPFCILNSSILVSLGA
jgi:hypothetical protein